MRKTTIELCTGDIDAFEEVFNAYKRAEDSEGEARMAQDIIGYLRYVETFQSDLDEHVDGVLKSVNLN